MPKLVGTSYIHNCGNMRVITRETEILWLNLDFQEDKQDIQRIFIYLFI